MARTWICAIVMAGVVLAAAGTLEAQRGARFINANSHKGKFSSGGFGADMLVATQLDGDFYRGEIVSGQNGNTVGRGKTVDRSDKVIGVGFDYQFGSDNDTMGTSLRMDINSYDVQSGGLKLFNESTVRIGFDFLMNFKKSEFVESDGRRVRDGVGVTGFIGTNLTMFVGDLRDLNGVGVLGFDAGIAFDLPFKGNEWQITPSSWLEINYHMSGDAQRSIFNATQTISAGGQPQFDGIVVRTHSLVSPFIFNLGGDFTYTPLFVGEKGNLINNWRFGLGAYINMPFAFNAFFANDPGDALKNDGDGVTYLTLTISAAYTW